MLTGVCEPEGRAAGDAGSAGEDVARVRLLAQGGGGEVFPGGRDVQRAEIVAAERGRGDPPDREAHDRIEDAARSVTPQFAFSAMMLSKSASSARNKAL